MQPRDPAAVSRPPQVTKRAFDYASPFVFQTARFAVGAVTLAAVYRREGLALRSHARGVLVVGTILAAGNSFQSAALLLIPPARAAFLTSLCVPLTPLLDSIRARALPPPEAVLAAAAAAAGTVLLTGGAQGGGWHLGDSLMICCAVLFACHFVTLNIYATPEGYKTIALGQMLVTTVLSLAIVPLDFPPRARATPYLVGAVFLTGFFATGVAFAAVTWAQSHLSASRTAIISATEPLFASLAALLVDGDTLGAQAIGGGALIIASILISSCDLRQLRRRCCGKAAQAEEEEGGGAEGGGEKAAAAEGADCELQGGTAAASAVAAPAEAVTGT